MDQILTNIIRESITKQTTKRPRILEESMSQRAFIKYCRMHPDIRIRMTFSIHNSGAKRPITYGRDLAEGLLAGVADVFIPCPTTTKHGLFLEFKSSKGKQTERQQAFEEFCHGQGYGYQVVRSVNEAIDQLMKYVEGRPST